MAREHLLAAGLIVTLGTGWAAAQEYDLSWYTFDGGGATFSTGGDFELGGTIGQPDAGVLSGGGFELVGGFWGGAGISFAQCQPCDTNCDGSINGQDIVGFVAALQGRANPCSSCVGDANLDGSVNGQDINAFVACLSP